MSIVRFETEQKFVPMSRHAAPTPDQVRNRRHALWLHAAEVGLPDPDTGLVRPYSRPELAGMFGVSVRTIQMGIAEARELREEIDRA